MNENQVDLIKKIPGVTVVCVTDGVVVLTLNSTLVTEDNVKVSYGDVIGHVYPIGFGFYDANDIIWDRIHAIIPDHKYFSTLAKAEEWVKKNSVLIPVDDLIKGKIYVDAVSSHLYRILRFENKSTETTISIYSQLLISSQSSGVNSYLTGTKGYYYKSLRSASLDEKKALIREEVKNGYFYNID